MVVCTRSNLAPQSSNFDPRASPPPPTLPLRLRPLNLNLPQGKTTVLLWLDAHLRESGKFTVLHVSMQGRPFQSVSSFWKGLHRDMTSLLGRRYPSLAGVPTAFDGSGDGQDQFRGLLDEVASFASLPVVLIVDEFDELEQLESDALDGLLGTLRSSTQKEVGLHAVVGAGSYAAVRLNSAAGSPFNTTDRVAMPPMSQDDVKGLLGAFSVAWEVDLHPRWVRILKCGTNVGTLVPSQLPLSSCDRNARLGTCECLSSDADTTRSPVCRRGAALYSTASVVWRVTGGHPGLVSAAGLMLADKSSLTGPMKWGHSRDTPLLQSKFEAGVAMTRLRGKLTSFLKGRALPGRCVKGWWSHGKVLPWGTHFPIPC